MDIKVWNNSTAKKLFDVFMEIENSQFPEVLRPRVRERQEKLERFIVEFGVDYITVNNYTNMMQFLSSITINVFDSAKWMEGNIIIDIGSEPQEFWALRKEQQFNFEKWEWEDRPKFAEPEDGG